MKQSYCVYRHTCKINGKHYIGQTRQKLEYRWRDGKGYKGTPFYYAITKYGWENFEHHIEADGLTLEEANKLEENLVKKYRSLTTQNGYNVKLGGSNHTLPESTRAKIGAAHKGVTHICPDEAKRKIGEANRGRVMPLSARETLSRKHTGKVLSEDHKRKISEGLLKAYAEGRMRPKHKPSRNRKAIVAIRLTDGFETEFPYISLAASALNINRTYISSVLSGRQAKTQGYTFKEVKK